MKKIIFLTLIILMFLIVLVSLIIFSEAVGFEIDKNEIKIKGVVSIEKEGIKLEYVPDEILVKFKPEISPEYTEIIFKEFELSKMSKIKKIEVYRLKIPPGINISEIVERLKKNPFVEFAEPNYIAYASMIPNDPYYQYQWHFDNPTYGGIHMKSAWDVTTGNSSVIVAVIDTGVAYENYPIPSYESKTVKRGITTYKKAPDLNETNFAAGYDFVSNDTHPNDNNGHGTHVTGTIAQTTNNNLGVAGIAFNTSIMPIKVLDYTGSGTYEQVANGIIYAVDNGAKIISMSLGGSSSSITLENAINYSYNNGVTVIAACGNRDGELGYTGGCDYPAAYTNVIAVGATQYDETKAPYSSYGLTLDLVAPGGNTGVDQNSDGYADGVLQQTFDQIYEDIPPTKADPTTFAYWFFQGTSMATPHVSGVAALLLALNNSLTPDQIRNTLQSTAEDLGSPGRDNTFGWGLINASAAVQAIAPPSEFISITLYGYPIDFGNLDSGTSDNLGIGNPYTIRVDDTTTVNVDIYQKGDNFNYNGKTLVISNMSWYNQNNSASSYAILNNYQNKISDISPRTNTSSYYWLDIPLAQYAGNYNTTIYIKAIKTGTSP